MKIETIFEKRYELLFRSYYRALVVYAEGILQNREEAEDVVQDLFMKLLNKGSITDIDSATEKNYMYTATKHLCLNMIRDNRMKYNSMPIEDVVSLQSSIKLEQSIIDTEELRIAYEAIEQLPPVCRDVFKKICIEGKKYDEVAKELGLSINTIKVQMFRAYRKLRKLIVTIIIIILSTFI